LMQVNILQGQEKSIFIVVFIDVLIGFDNFRVR